MELNNEFVVPTDPENAWAVLTDVPRIAPCLPGATVEPVAENEYTGSVSVKVGPIKVSYGGTATFRELDPATLRMVLDARGKEKSGKGSAAAVVTVALHGEGADQTRVDVRTDLQITGKLAQFGRSALADVGTRLIDQFATNLETLLRADGHFSGPVTPGAHETPSGGAQNSTSSAPPVLAADLDALALVGPMLRRVAPTVAAFAAGILLTWLVGRAGTARAGARPAARPGCAPS